MLLGSQTQEANLLERIDISRYRLSVLTAGRSLFSKATGRLRHLRLQFWKASEGTHGNAIAFAAISIVSNRGQEVKEIRSFGSLILF